MVSDESFTALIERIVDARVDAKLAHLTGGMTSEAVYRSRGGVLPPGCRNGRAMTRKLLAYGIPHTVEGTGTQSVRVVSVAAWHAGLSRSVRPRTRKVPAPVVTDDDDALASAALAAVGLRATGGAR